MKGGDWGALQQKLMRGGVVVGKRVQGVVGGCIEEKGVQRKIAKGGSPNKTQRRWWQ